MRLKEIKPGMVIHCKTEEEKMALKTELKNRCYHWTGGFNIGDVSVWGGELDLLIFVKEDNNIQWARPSEGQIENANIIEFSDLIIPELSAKEVLETLHDMCSFYNSEGRQCDDCPADPYCVSMSFKDGMDSFLDACTKWREEHPKEEEREVEVEQFWEIKCLEDPSYHTTEHYKDEAEALRMCVILAQKDPKNSYYAVFVAKAKE
jgi:hypothetical protein